MVSYDSPVMAEPHSRWLFGQETYPALHSLHDQVADCTADGALPIQMQPAAGLVLLPLVARDQGVQLWAFAANEKEPIQIAAVRVEQNDVEALDLTSLLQAA